MKRKLFCLFLVLSCLMCSICYATDFQTNETETEDPFSYPYEYELLPYMPEWDELSKKEQIEAYNLPLWILKTLSTKDLFYTFLQVDSAFDSYVIHNSELDFCFAYEYESNLFRELIARPDIETVLEELAEEGSPYPSDYDPNISSYVSRENYLKWMSSKFDLYVALVSCGAQYSAMKQAGFFRDIERYPGDIDFGTSWLDDLGKRWTDGTVAVFAKITTPRGTSVPEAYLGRHPDWTADERADQLRKFIKAHPALFTIYQEPTKVYNCHSYAWYWHATGNNIWMDNPEPYIDDGSYVKCTSGETIKTGYIAYYRFGAHSAVVDHVDTDGTVWVVSKWGTDCLALHPARTEVYEYGGPVAYYKPA